MAFNLKDYESVKKRKQRFYETNKDGRIVVHAEKITAEEAIFFVQIFKNADDQRSNLAWSTGYAQEFKGVGSMANKTSWCENCEESAIGRALDNAGYASYAGPSLEEMQKVERAERAASHPAAYTVPVKTENNNTLYLYEPESPEDFQIPFGGDMGKRLKSFSRDDLKQKLVKMKTYLSDNPKAAQMYQDTARAIELVLGGELKI